MKKKRPIEADLDPQGTPRTRPGAETARRALALARGKTGTGSSKKPTRPGAHAARRALSAIRRRGKSQ